MSELDQWLQEGVLAAPVLDEIRAIVTADIHEDEMADRAREAWQAVTTIEFAAVVSDLLQAQGIISKYFWRRLIEWRGYISPVR